MKIFIPYINALGTAIANTEAQYVLKPQSSHEETIYYYYLKDVDAGTYAFVNPDATDNWFNVASSSTIFPPTLMTVSFSFIINSTFLLIFPPTVVSDDGFPTTRH